MDDRTATGEATITFDLTGYQPGSYVVALYHDGDYKSVYPVVVKGYDVSVDVPTTTTPDSTIDATVTLSQISDTESPQNVEIIITDHDQTLRVTAEKHTAKTYNTTISVDALDTGTYRVYAVVQGNDDAFKDGKREALGISDASTITIQEQHTSTETTSQPTNSPTTTHSATQSPTTSNATTTPTSTTSQPSQTSQITTSPSQSTQTTTTTKTVTQTKTATTTVAKTSNSQVITPAKSTTTPTTTPAQGIPGFEFGTSILALIGALYLATRR